MSRVRTESTGESLCPVCHENAEIHAIGPCDHPICYRCSTRMRVLCDQTYCPICRGELPQIVHFTSRQKYDSVDRRNCIPNRKYKILFEDETVEDAFQALLEDRCQFCDSRPLFNNFKSLQSHVNRTHKLFACDLCVSHLKIFPFERKFYNRSDLATHRRVGDPDNRSYRGHPLCRFCDDRYMDNDELYRHLRKAHYYCHFCDSTSSKNEFFDDYPHLKEHFKREHFLCEEGQCGRPETRLTHAFATDIDYRAHVAAEHMDNKSKLQAKELRTIDVGFHVAPRRRGRDAGVIAPEDFEEVSDYNRGPRDRRQRRYNNHHEASSRSDTMTPPPPTTEASGPPAPQPPAIDDFPVLGNCPPPFVPTAAQKPAEAVEDFPSLSSNAQSKSTAITTSSLVPPTTRPGKSSVSAVSQKQPANLRTIASSIASSGSGHPSGARNTPPEAQRPTQATTVTKQSWGAPRLASGEDFPSLGGGKKDKAAKDGPNYVTLGAWTKKSERSRPPSSKSNGESPSVRPASSLASLGRSLCDDGEFPSLGGSSAPKQATWIQKNAKPAKNKTEKSTPLGNCLTRPAHSKEKAAQVNGAPEKKTDQTESKKKKKKQKEKQTKASTGDSGISLGSIASEIDSLAGSSELTSTVKDVFSEPNSCPGVSSNDQADGADRISEQKSTVKESSAELENGPDTSPRDHQTASAVSVDNRASDENDGWETVTTKKGAAFQEDDFPSLCPASNRSNGKWTSSRAVSAETTTNKKNKALVTTTTKTYQEDFPSFSSISERTLTPSFEQNSTSEKKREKKSGRQPPPKSLREDDFPQLSAPTKKTKPPPGFHKAEVAAPPPGLGAKPSSESRAPPGLTSVSPASTALGASNIPMTVKLHLFPFVVSDQEKQRNNALATLVRDLLILKVAGFDRFCALSRDFRSGQLSALEYHKTCLELFGEQKFLEILPELVALLPDILKQHELVEAHNQSILGICARLNLKTCPTCHQYLQAADLAEHRNSHANLG